MKDDKRDINEVNSNQENAFYGNFEKKQDDNVQNNINNNTEVNPVPASNYVNTNTNTNTLEKNTVLTKSSKASKFILYGFYLMLLVIGAIAFFMIRANKYEFYLNEEEVSINRGSTYQVSLTPKNARYFDYLNYNYSVADENVATVDEYGKVTAVGPGRTTLKISLSPGFTSKTMTIISEDVDISNITLMIYRNDELIEGNSVEMSVDQSINLKAIANGREELATTVKYSSSDPSVAKVDEFGNVIAKSSGAAIITGSRNGVEGSINIIVNDNKPTDSNPIPAPKIEKPTEITNINFTTSSVSVNVNKSARLVVVVKPKELGTSNLEWTSYNPGVARVDSNGVVTGVSEGETTISVRSSNGVSATCDVKVTTKKVDVNKIYLNATKKTIKVNGSFQLIATVEPKDATNAEILWSSSNSKVATVTGNGLVSGIATGTAEITAKTKDGKVTAKSVVTVQKQETTTKKVVLNMTNTEVYVGERLSLSAALEPSTGTNHTVSWSSSKTSVATVDKSGKILAVAAGTAVITAKIDGIEANCIVVVRNKTTATPTPTVKATTKPTTAPTSSANEPSIPASTFDKQFIKVSTDRIELSKNETKEFKISAYNVMASFALTTKAAVSSDSTIHVTLDTTETDVDGLSSSNQPAWKDATIKVTGKSSGYTYIVIEPGSGDIVTYDDPRYLTGSHTILVHVK